VVDPWIGCKGNYELFEALINALYIQGIHTFMEETTQNVTYDVSQGWLTTNLLNLQGEMVQEWTQYVKLLTHSAIRLSYEEDVIKWYKNNGI
jgi:hypothetical protein